MRSLPEQANDRRRREHTAYLRALLQSESAPWKGRWTRYQEKYGAAFPQAIAPQTLSVKDCEQISTVILRDLEEDISERAITTGLIVGVSPNPWIDQITIIAAAFEIQLYVLSRLGKKPSWYIWREMVKRSLFSIFANTYLNREQAFV